MQHDTVFCSGVPLRKAKKPIPVERTMAAGGMVYWRKNSNQVDAALLPSAATPYGRMVRIHELLHAAYSRPRSDARFLEGLPEILQQALEDVRVHLEFWPWPLGSAPPMVRECAQAVVDADFSRLHENNAIWAQPNSSLRVEGIAMALRTCSLGRQVNPICLSASLPCDMSGRLLVRQICDLVQAGRWKEAAALLRSPQPGSGPSSEDGSEDGWAEEEEISAGRIALMGGFVPPPSAGQARNYADDMRIVELPLTEPCRSDDAAQRWRSGATGTRLYRSRLAMVFTNPQRASRSLLRRRIRRQGQGTLVLDASGSMNISQRKLLEFCQSMPHATVAYYSGSGKRRSYYGGCYGELTIFARDGFRAGKIVRPEGGNAVDWGALDWLLRQSAPRYFVSDLGFSGGSCGAAQAAMALFRRALAAGDLVHFCSVREAQAALCCDDSSLS